jgi:hypothetical protein
MSRLLIATRHSYREDEDEAEPVLVEQDEDDPRLVVLVLDDGDRITLDRVELAAAIAG